jgi:Zn-dependent protease with chaperone function
MKYIPRQPDSNVNVTATSPLRDFLVMLTGVALILVAVYFVLGFLVDFMVPRISPETEKLLGTFFDDNGPEKGPPSEETAYLQGLVDQIQGQCADLPYELQVEIIDDEMINALALPGGRIVVFSGLLEKARSQNELAFVLSHEMGHFANKDHLSGLGRGLVFMTLSASVFGTDSAVGRKIGQLLEVSELSLSRKHESMADKFALRTVNCFYGHVAGAADFFEHTAEMEESFFTGHYLSTHPLSEERIARLHELAGERGYTLQGELVPFAGTK